jgi:hypothetical protein
LNIEANTPLISDVPGANFIFDMSPTNSMWASTDHAPPSQSKQTDGRFSRLEGRECRRRLQEVTNDPTDFFLLHAAMIRDDTDIDQVALWQMDVLRELLTTYIRRDNIYITAAATYESDENTPFKQHTYRFLLQSHRKCWPMLGAKIDALHPVLVAKRDTCNGVYNALAPLATENNITFQRPEVVYESRDLALMHVPRRLILNPQSNYLVRDWLVPMDDSTADYRFGDGPGEYRIGGILYFARWRFEEVRAQRKLESSNLVMLPMIHDKYLSLIGIEPGDMLVAGRYLQNYHAEQELIDDAFNSLGSEINIKKRIWLAHDNVWKRRTKPMSLALRRFILDRYFRNRNY